MKVESVTTPWRHWIIDEFLPESDYLHLRNWFDDQPAMTQAERVDSDDMAIPKSKYPNEILDPLHGSFLEAMSYTNWRGFGRIAYQLDRMLPNESYFKTHCDSPSKLASLVLYVGEPNKGTFIHESEDSEPLYEIPWVETALCYS